MTTTYTRIVIRRDTAANWTSANPVLVAGEFGVNLDTLTFKIGDGTKTWAQLPYAGGGAMVLGTRGAPVAVTSPIAPPATNNTFLFAVGNGGPQSIINIGAPPAVGAVLVITCRSASNTVTLTTGGNIDVNGGTLILGLGSVVTLVYDGTNYVEVSRNGV